MKLGIPVDTTAVAVGEGSVMSILEILLLLTDSDIYRSSQLSTNCIGLVKPVITSTVVGVESSILILEILSPYISAI